MRFSFHLLPTKINSGSSTLGGRFRKDDDNDDDAIVIDRYR